jgi:hypothetical protein
MKIYDIISEAPSTAGTMSPGGIIIPAGSRTAAPQAPAPTAPNTGPQISKTRRATRAVTSAATGPRAKWVGEKIKKVILRDKIAGEVVNNKMLQALGGHLRFLKMVGYGAIAYEIWQQKIAIDTLIKEGQISKEDGNAAYRAEALKFVAAIVASAALRAVIRIITTISGLRWFLRIAGGLGAGVSAGGTIAIALATEAAIVYLTNKLTTPEGQEMLGWMVMNIIDPAAVWMYNMGFGKFFGEIKEISPEGGAKVAAATSADAQKRAAAKGGQGANPAPAAGAVPAKAAIDATSTEPEDPTLAATKATIGDIVKPGDKKWGTGNAGFPKAGGGNVDPSEYNKYNNKAPR